MVWISVLAIMLVVFLQMKGFGAILTLILSFGFIIKYAWSKENV